MEIYHNTPNYSNIIEHAIRVRDHIDARILPDKNDIKDYQLHLEDCYNHPTTGLLTQRQYITKNKFNNPKEALRNIEIMEHNADIISLINKLDFKLKRLYIKTKPAREYIIEHDRISLDSIQPSKPYTFLNRVAIFLKKIHII